MFEGTITKGVLLEIRQLKTKSSGEVWRTIAKIAYIGGAVEAIIPDGLQMPPAGSENIYAHGLFEESMGKMNLVLEECKIAKS